jgi:hypothetical protein
MRIKVVIGSIIFLVLFSMAPTMYEWNARGRIHADRVFELVHNFPTDYNLYLSKIRLGKEGAWLATEKYTSEPHSGSLSQIMYVLIGRLADWSHVQTPYVWFAYHTARVFFAALLLWMVWKLAEWVFQSSGFVWQYLGFLLIATQSTWPKFETVLGIPRLGGWMPWYTQADSLQRTTFMPHVLFSQMLMIFIIWVFSGGFITRKHPGNAVFLGFVGLILGIVFPPGLMFIVVVLGMVTANLFDRLVFGIITIPSVVYFTLLLGQYPWKRLVEFDVLHPTKFSFIEYFMAVGPLFPIGILGVIVLGLLGKWGILGRLKYFIAWIVAWLVLLFVFDKIPQQSPTRFTQMVPQVPLGVFTGLLFWESVKRFQKFKHVLYAIPVIIILFAFGSMASSYMWLQDFVDHKLRATIPLVPHNAEVMYPMKDIAEGLVWLQVYTPRKAVVLTGMATGNYVPVYAGNTAFLGHANTVQLEIKQAAMQNFYNNRLGEETEMNWIKDQKIDYIFYSFEERDLNGGIDDLRTYYPTLTIVYDTPTVRIYKTP